MKLILRFLKKKKKKSQEFLIKMPRRREVATNRHIASSEGAEIVLPTDETVRTGTPRVPSPPSIPNHPSNLLDQEHVPDNNAPTDYENGSDDSEEDADSGAVDVDDPLRASSRRKRFVWRSADSLMHLEERIALLDAVIFVNPFRVAESRGSPSARLEFAKVLDLLKKTPIRSNRNHFEDLSIKALRSKLKRMMHPFIENGISTSAEITAYWTANRHTTGNSEMACSQELLERLTCVMAMYFGGIKDREDSRVEQENVTALEDAAVRELISTSASGPRRKKRARESSADLHAPGANLRGANRGLGLPGADSLNDEPQSVSARTANRAADSSAHVNSRVASGLGRINSSNGVDERQLEVMSCAMSREIGRALETHQTAFMANISEAFRELTTQFALLNNNITESFNKNHNKKKKN